MADLETRFKNREKAKDDAIAKLTAGYGQLDNEVKTTLDAVKSGRDRTDVEVKHLTTQVMEIRKNAAEGVTKAEADRKRELTAKQEKEKELRESLEKIRKLDRQEMDVPSGEITWVSLPNKMVWINRGRADALQRQTKFTVYSPASSSAAKAVKKGLVEVVSITGEHDAQCRIVEDKLTDPMMAGDKVFTPLWSPGQSLHFALAGIMNLDGDGHNQINVATGLIHSNGGEVDCWLDETGHKQGQITNNTSYIVVGDSPTDKGSSEKVKNNREITSEADRYYLHKMTLSEFKQKRNYQKSSSTEDFRSGATSSGVPAKAGNASNTGS
jgi:hypothetical protein